MAVTDRIDAELATLYIDTGIELSSLPDIMTADQLAPALQKTVDALAQDRYRHRGIPYVRVGRRIRYLRVDVARYLIANRHGVTASTA